MIRGTFSFFFFLFCFTLNSQNETAKWYFGDHAGLDFITNPPTVLTNNAMYQMNSWNSASVSDGNGNLLFYSDGDTVYTKQHLLMANGVSTVSCVSAYPVKQPGNNNLYYLFTIQNDLRLYYSVIDMSLSAGMGSVTAKNVLLSADSFYVVGATRHCNGKDVWFIAHKYNSPEFRSYLLTASGTSPAFISSFLGPQNQIFLDLKINHSGTKIAGSVHPSYITPMNNVAYNTTINGTFNIFDFDNNSGLVSNQLILGSCASAWYCDFSPDGSKLYGGNWWDGTLFQWDLCAGSGPSIAASVYTVYSSGTASEVHDIRTAQNGKTYVATGSKSYLGVINNPNLYGAACNFVPAGQSLAQKNSLQSLPRFMSSYLKISPFNVAISSSINCQTASFFSSLPASTLCSATGYSVAAVLWNFGDPASGSNNSSTLANPVHIYSAPGSYTVKEIIYNTSCAPDTLLKAITVFGPAATLSVTGPSVICKGQSATFSVSGASTYTWSTVPLPVTNNMSISVSPTVTTIYTIIGTNTVSNCTDKKTITLTVAKCTGIDEGLSGARFINIYPNPGSIFTIESVISFDAELYGQHGEKVMNFKLLAGFNLLDLRKYQNGLYFLRIHETGFVYKLAKTD
jgi:hypothetical protein